MNIHLYPSGLKNESRILKIVHSLNKYQTFEEIVVLGKMTPGLRYQEVVKDGIRLIRLKPIFGSRLNGTLGKVFTTIGWYLAVLFWIRSRKINCLNCHSLPVLALSVFIKIWKSCTLIYDTHELETETNGMRGLIQYFSKRLERRLIKSVDAVCVVNHSIADWYKKNYCLEYVWVVHNAPYQMGAMPKRKGLLRKAIGVQDHELLFIYQGLLSSGRGIEILLKVFSNSGINTHVVFMGYGPNESLVRQAAMCNPNIHFMPAVSPKLVFDYTVDADVGISLIEHTCLSYYLCAPNKLYEYAACGVVPIVSNFPEMSSFIDKYDCGWKIEPTAVALSNLLKSIDKETIAIKKVNALDAGAQHCWENEEKELMRMYKSLKL